MLTTTIQPLCAILLRLRCIWCAFSISVVFPCVSTAGDADDYLSAISIEAEKVEESNLSDAQSRRVAKKAGIEPTLSEFESELKSRYRGSYTFYRKLPTRSREAIFMNFLDGVPMSDIRKKIMDRFLNN